MLDSHRLGVVANDVRLIMVGFGAADGGLDER
jgi:hypothetical protein